MEGSTSSDSAGDVRVEYTRVRSSSASANESLGSGSSLSQRDPREESTVINTMRFPEGIKNLLAQDYTHLFTTESSAEALIGELRRALPLLSRARTHFDRAPFHERCAAFRMLTEKTGDMLA